MKKSIFCFLFMINALFPVLSFSQETRFFMPSEIQKAYAKGTRSFDGNPGKNYWQNTATYTIRVTVDPSRNLLTGEEEIEYRNNAPDELNQLVIRLYGDLYKKGNMRLRLIDGRDITNGVQINNLGIDGTSINVENPNVAERKGTNLILKLPKPMLTNSSVKLHISWRQELPEYTKIRHGVYDSTSIIVAYWYPQIAVYDDLFGWDESTYLGNTEFYNDLASFDVQINVPENYVVWATGSFTNAGEVLPQEVFERYQLAAASGKEMQIISESDIKKGFRSPTGKWHFVANEVTDFSLALSNRHSWTAITRQVAGHSVLIQSISPLGTGNEVSDHLRNASKAMEFFSTGIPGIPFPFEAFTTIVNKGAEGMEYPMMANNGSRNRVLTVHELFHSYFPMFVRTNEHIWAWMDEGLATFNTRLALNEIAGNPYYESEIFSNVAFPMGTNDDLPLMIPSQYLDVQAYKLSSYQVPDLVLSMLYEYLGREGFLNCYRSFIERWAKKSPTPYDFMYTFENISGKDLSWLFKPWFFEFGFADLAIISVENGILTVENKGNKPIPVCIELIYNNDSFKLVNENAFIWANARKQIQIIIPDYTHMKQIIVNKLFPDRNHADNYYPLESYPF